MSSEISGVNITISAPFTSTFDGWKLKTEEPEITLNTNIEDIKVSDVVGLNDAKEMLERRLLIYLNYKDKMSRTLSKGILIYGYPGTGKTMLVKAVMKLMDPKKVLCVIADESDLTGQSNNTTEKVKQFFNKIRIEANGRDVLLLFDEAEGIIGKKDGKGILSDKRVAQLLREIDGLENKNKDIFILATTNHPGKIEEAMLRSGRIDYHIKVNLPNEHERYLLIKQYVGTLPGISEQQVSAIMIGTPDWTGANYAQLGAELEMEYLINNKLTNEIIFKIVEQIQKFSKRNFKSFEKEYKKYMNQ